MNDQSSVEAADLCNELVGSFPALQMSVSAVPWCCSNCTVVTKVGKKKKGGCGNYEIGLLVENTF